LSSFREAGGSAVAFAVAVAVAVAVINDLRASQKTVILSEASRSFIARGEVEGPPFCFYLYLPLVISNAVLSQSTNPICDTLNPCNEFGYPISSSP
jgi:hypothetical protein